MAPLLRSKTSAISSSLRDALPLPAPRCTLLVALRRERRGRHLRRRVAGQRARAAAVAAAQAGGVDAAAARADLRGDQRALRARRLADLAGEILGHRRLVEHRVVAQVGELILQLEQAGVLRALARVGFGGGGFGCSTFFSGSGFFSSIFGGGGGGGGGLLLDHQLDDAVGNLRRLHLVALAAPAAAESGSRRSRTR